MTTIWTRRGETAETDDFAAGHVDPITRADLASSLSAHHEEDLAALGTDEERAEAADAAGDADALRRAQAEWAEACEAEARP